MKTFEAGCKAYHAANSELEAHYGSEQGIEIRNKVPGFYPISTDGLIRAENFRSCRATLRRIRGL